MASRRLRCRAVSGLFFLISMFAFAQALSSEMSRYLWSRLAWGLVQSGIGTMVHYWFFEVTVTRIGIARCLSTPENWKTPRKQQNTSKKQWFQAIGWGRGSLGWFAFLSFASFFCYFDFFLFFHIVLSGADWQQKTKQNGVVLCCAYAFNLALNERLWQQ